MKLIKDLGMMFPTTNSKQKTRFGIYECPSCFCEFKTIISNVKKGNTKRCSSCSNKGKNITHGMIKHKLYKVWTNERNRCNNVKNKNFKHYGGRGIKVSEEFNYFPTWLKYVESLENFGKEAYTLDRIDNNKGYERGNLRWANRNTQARNTRKLYRHNTSGYRGVHKKGEKWAAQIIVNCKHIYLGYYNHPYTAAYAYDSYVLNNKLEHSLNFIV